MSKKKYCIGIIGGGAVGLTYAALLSETRLAEVIVKSRSHEQADLIKSQGISMTTAGKEEIFTGIDATADMNVLAQCDAVIVTVKSYDTAAVARELTEIVRPDTVVITLQNGLQAFDVLLEHLSGRALVLDGVTLVGASRSDARSIIHSGSFKTFIDARAGELMKILQATRFSVEASPDVRQAVWDKMVLSTGQNALSAITGLTLGEMLQSEYCLEVAAQLLGELEQVAQAEGMSFNYSLIDKLKDNWKMSTFRPSMWQDLQKGNRTEIDAINGAIGALGKNHHISTPYNDMITSLIKILENRSTIKS